MQAQFGLVTRVQGVDFFGRGEFERRVARADFVRLVRGLYRVAGVPTSPEQTLFASTLIFGGPASHRASAAIRGFDRYDQIRPEVTIHGTTGSRTRDLGHKTHIHRTNFLPDSHIELVRGIPTTTAARTICDLSVFLGASSLGRLLDDAKRRGLVTYEAVAECRNELRRRGRRRITVVDEMLDDRGVDFDPGDSEPELDLRLWLEDAGLPPVTQHLVVVGGKKRRLDLAYPRPKVAVEYLGLAGHTLPSRVIDDSQRTTELQLAGWFVVLITKGTGRRRAVEMVREAIELRGGL